MKGRNRRQVYWLAQMGGWGLFVFGNVLWAKMQQQQMEGLYTVSLCIFLVGILITHLFRFFIHQWGLKRWNILLVILVVIPLAPVLSFIFMTVSTTINDLINDRVPLVESIGTPDFWQNTFNFSILFLLWSIIYFAVNTFENWKREEINNLELRAAKTEIELNSFKSQMNPHFMFNSMNSIRALVDENPDKAKQAITMLSGLLRNNLTLGKRQTIPLKEELDLVDKYLSLEKIRFEERLHVQMNIAPETLGIELPPFMLQTIVENAIKHGISRRMDGGTIVLSTSTKEHQMLIEIVNTGQFVQQESSDGIGLANTRKRLELLYGSNASFEIYSSRQDVHVELKIPIHNPDIITT